MKYFFSQKQILVWLFCCFLFTQSWAQTTTDENVSFTLVRNTTKIADDKIPTLRVRNIALPLNANGEAHLTVDMIDNGSFDESGISSMTLSQTKFDCSHLGGQRVTLTVIDNHGNKAETYVYVKVKDVTPPVAKTKNITVSLNPATGVADIIASDIDNGSYDICGIKVMSVFPSSFTAKNIGENTVTFTLEDDAGYEVIATAVVTVKNSMAPAMAKK